MLTHEETRRRVSIDFTLSDAELGQLRMVDGVVAPISVLTKQARRNFDLRDESGRAIPVLGRGQNGDLAHIAVLSAALDALGEPSLDLFEMLAADMRKIVFDDPVEALDALAFFVGSAENGDPVRAAIWRDPTCKLLLQTLSQHYVLFAVLAPRGSNRRILKYSYSEDFNFGERRDRLRGRSALGEVWRRALRPDRLRFTIECPGAWRAASFHAEIAMPEELQFEQAVLFDFSAAEAVSEYHFNVDRASLYANQPLASDGDVQAYVEVTPERAGRTSQAVATGVLVAGLLWLGVLSGLDSKNPGAAVSILVGGAALFSGFAAARGQHKLVRLLFSATQRWLGVITVAALTGSATLAMEYPTKQPVAEWRWAALASTVALVRLMWTAIRAPK